MPSWGSAFPGMAAALERCIAAPRIGDVTQIC